MTASSSSTANDLSYSQAELAGGVPFYSKTVTDAAEEVEDSPYAENDDGDEHQMPSDDERGSLGLEIEKREDEANEFFEQDEAKLQEAEERQQRLEINEVLDQFIGEDLWVIEDALVHMSVSFAHGDPFSSFMDEGDTRLHVQELCLQHQIPTDRLVAILDCVKEDNRRWRMNCRAEIPATDAHQKSLTKAKISRCKREGLITCGNTSYDMSEKKAEESIAEFHFRIDADRLARFEAACWDEHCKGVPMQASILQHYTIESNGFVPTGYYM